jgi:hypothetical protein
MSLILKKIKPLAKFINLYRCEVCKKIEDKSRVYGIEKKENGKWMMDWLQPEKHDDHICFNCCAKIKEAGIYVLG